MLFFKSKSEKHLDNILLRLEMNMSNNYKDNAQDNLKEFEHAYEEYKTVGKLSEKACKYYSALLEEYRGKLKGYTHKDQTPYWTK